MDQSAVMTTLLGAVPEVEMALGYDPSLSLVDLVASELTPAVNVTSTDSGIHVDLTTLTVGQST